MAVVENVLVIVLVVEHEIMVAGLAVGLVVELVTGLVVEQMYPVVLGPSVRLSYVNL